MFVLYVYIYIHIYMFVLYIATQLLCYITSPGFRALGALLVLVARSAVHVKP